MGWRSTYSKIVGVTHTNPGGRNRQRVIRECREGEWLVLEREPDNPVDTNAIKILRQNGEQLGYVTSYFAQSLAHDLDAGRIVRCSVSNLTGGGKHLLGVNIEVSIWHGGGVPTSEDIPATFDLSLPPSARFEDRSPALGILVMVVIALAVIWAVLRQ